MSSIKIFHATNIILAGNSKFNIIGSIHQGMLCDILAASDILRAYHSLPLSCFRPLTNEMQKVLDEVDKLKRGEKKKGAKVGPSKLAPSPKREVNESMMLNLLKQIGRWLINHELQPQAFKMIRSLK